MVEAVKGGGLLPTEHAAVSAGESGENSLKKLSCHFNTVFP